MPQKKAKRTKKGSKTAHQAKAKRAMKIAQKYKKDHPGATMSTCLKHGWKNI